MHRRQNDAGSPEQRCANQHRAFAPKREFSVRVQADAICPVLRAKIFRFAFSPNHLHKRRRPAPFKEGRLANRHERWVWDAVDAIGTSDECADRGRRSRVVLTPRRWRQVGGDDPSAMVAKKPGSPGRARRKPLKPFACGNAGLNRRTCGDYARVVFIFPTRGCGCACASGIPHALFGADEIGQTRAQRAAGM